MININIKYVIIGLIILILSSIVIVQRINLQKTRENLEVSRNNEKAYANGISIWQDKYNQEHAKTRVFEESINSFKNSADSVNKKILKQLELQGIKLKKLDQIVYQEVKIDTSLNKIINIPIMPDTVIDLSNQWVTNVLTLSPTLVKSDIKLENELFGTFTKKKETIQTPKKFFLFRLFQRKHTVIEADFYNTNPLIRTKNQKIIQIVD